MAEVSLYRKYRPQNFTNLVGQDHIRTTLINALKDNHTAHAYLFCGPRGTGKTSTARLIAKALNCQDPKDGYEPCDKCDFCIAISDGSLIDLIEIDAASNRGIDEIRDLKDKINFAPTRTKYKVYIIDEVHMLTKEAFNALLKTLEEPPDHAYFILATTEAHKIPETIISRCQRFDFKRITQKAIVTRLMYIAQLEKIDAQQEAIEAIAHSSEGGLRDAIGLLDQLMIDKKLDFDRVQEVLGISGRSALEKLYSLLKSNSTHNALTEINNLYAEGFDLAQFTKDFLEFLRQKMIEATSQNQMEETRYLLDMIDNFQKAHLMLKTTTIPQLPLEKAIIETTLEHVVPVQASAQTSAQAAVQETVKKTAEEKSVEIQPERTHASIKKNISEEESSEPEEKVPLTISYVKEHWPRIIERIKTPFVRLSFKEGKPIQVENGEVLVEYTSNFHKEKIDSNEIKVEIESAFNTIFQDPVKIAYVVRKVELTPKTDDDDLASHALEMFGGEFIED